MRDGGLVERREGDERDGNLLCCNRGAVGSRCEDTFCYKVTLRALSCQRPFC